MPSLAALAYPLPQERDGLAAAVRRRHEPGTAVVVSPNPSPMNNRWLLCHPWFEAERVPELQTRVAEVLRG